MQTKISLCFLSLLAAGNLFAGSPLVSVSASPFSITNENEEATYTLTLSAPATRNVSVAFFMTGSAVPGFDYILLGNFNKSGQVVIPAGQSSATVTLHTLPDEGYPAREIATLNVLNAARYHIGSPSRADVIILSQR
jgi:hypothetical protein